jgi:hypothetical protein
MRGPYDAPLAVSSGSRMNRRGGETLAFAAERFMACMLAHHGDRAFGRSSKMSDEVLF